MFHDFFAKSPLLFLPLFSLAFFGMMFLAILVYVIRAGRVLEARAMLPLDDEAGHE